MATYLNEVLKYQQKSKEIAEVSIVLSDFEVSKEDYEYTNSYFYNYIRKPKYFINALREINKVVREENPDIIHLHSTFAGLFARIPLFLKKKKPLVIYCSHGWSFTMDIPSWKKKIYGMVEYLLATKTDLIINISENELNQSRNYNIPENKSTVIYNGIEEKVQNKPQETPRINIDPTKINLLFIGRFDTQKGIDILIDFFTENKFDHIQLYLIGGSVLNDTSLILPDNMISLGWVNNEKIDSYYQLFDAVIIPSRWEGFGLVAIEAMRNKKALIVSNRGALPEIVERGSNGYVFNIEDINTLKEILLSTNKEQLVTMGERGYKIFLDKFTSLNMNKEIIRQYRFLIHNIQK
ncbi:glycosyltransferase [Priestia megaterium]|uniref:glycosyltransferase n=1 Tax=Priestia megaterium TaxID=1404 RepID=UPI0036D8D754